MQRNALVVFFLTVRHLNNNNNNNNNNTNNFDIYFDFDFDILPRVQK